MNAAQFVRKWAASTRSERAASQEHFIDLCGLLGEDTPNTDPSGDYYAFEKGARTLDGEGYADVWLKGHFAWEYKGKHKDLDIAFRQLLRYREALESPPLLVVCDFDRYEVHTNWTNTEKWIYRFTSASITTDDPVLVTNAFGPPKDAPRLTGLQVLKALWRNPDELKPQRTTEQITKEAAAQFEKIADVLRKYGTSDVDVARFVTHMVFCMFATDVDLLPRQTFSAIFDAYRAHPDAAAFRAHLAELFSVMNTGGTFMMRRIPRIDGRLFEDASVPVHVEWQQIVALEQLDKLNWSDVEPAVFGTLFERILDPSKRGTGAHYTSRDDIELIVEPVLMYPLREEWRRAKAEVLEYLNDTRTQRAKPETRKERVRALIARFQNRLATVRVLDPACGSGNFLYVSLALLKALEKEVIALADLHGIEVAPRVHPSQLHGIEFNTYACEMASVVVWIGYLQWKSKNMIPLTNEIPVLQPLDQIVLKDAVLDLSDPKRPREPEWPEADVVVGNPPFLGGKRLRAGSKNLRHGNKRLPKRSKRLRDRKPPSGGLGDEYVDALFAVYDSRVVRESDLCCYWFEKARAAIEAGRAKRAGLLATQAIRGGANRRVLERIKETGDIFYAQADRKWIQDGVAVRVSMVGFDDGSETRRLLNEDKDDDPRHALLRAMPVEGINANLTHLLDLTQARRLKENAGISFMGDTKVGPFDIPARVARDLLAKPNPHGKPNSDVVRPWFNGLDITRRPRNMWIIDYPPGMTEQEAALYEAPFEYIKRHVKKFRATARSGDRTGVAWWIHQRPRPDMRHALAPLNRYVATARVTKYRIFVWVDGDVLCDSATIVFARSDDYFFGVLHSRAHEAWARATGTQLREAGSGFRYTPTTCFETFPFPHGTQEQHWAISLAAKDLDTLRNGWLNPPSGGIAPSELKRRTLTNLYNERPTWLQNAHRTLDEAVFAAYGWREIPADLADGEILGRLLRLNLDREAL